MIRHAAAVSGASVIRQGRQVRRPDVTALAAVLATASIFVMGVSTAALGAITGLQRQLRRLTGKESLTSVLVRGPATRRPRKNAHRVERIRDPVNLHRAPGVLHRGLNPRAVPPRRYVECHSVALFLRETESMVRPHCNETVSKGNPTGEPSRRHGATHRKPLCRHTFIVVSLR